MEDFDDIDFIYCPACESELSPEAATLGTLGYRVHYQCLFCGMQWSVSLVTEEEI